MRRWKQVSIYCLAAALTAAGPVSAAWAASPSFARTAEEWATLQDNVMDYGELAGLVHEYNVTVQSNQLDFNKNKDKSSDDIAQKYREQASTIRSGMSGEDDAMSLASDAMSEASALNLDKLADENVSDSEILKMTYDQTEATLVSSAQTNMISYHQKVMDLELKQKNKELLSATYDSVAAKQQVGMATQMDILTAKENLLNAEGAILTAQSDIQNVKQKLCVMLGWKYDSSPEIREIPSADITRIGQIDLQADQAAALTNNYTLKINNKKLANAYGNSTKDSLNITIEDNKQKIGTSVSSAYKSVQQSKIAYDQAVSELELEKKNMEAAERKLAIGYISRLDYLTEQYTYLQKQINEKNADMSLFQALESYNWAVNGLASTS